jgi:hypothetical protein
MSFLWLLLTTHYRCSSRNKNHYLTFLWWEAQCGLTELKLGNSRPVSCWASQGNPLPDFPRLPLSLAWVANSISRASDGWWVHSLALFLVPSSMGEGASDHTGTVDLPRTPSLPPDTCRLNSPCQLKYPQVPEIRTGTFQFTADLLLPAGQCLAFWSLSLCFCKTGWTPTW